MANIFLKALDFVALPKIMSTMAWYFGFAIVAFAGKLVDEI
jgi:hypothetical protein